MTEAVQSRPSVMVERDARPGAAGKVGDEPRRRPPSRGQFGFRLGSVARVEIRVDWSLAVVVWLIVVSLAMGRFPSLHPDWSAAMVWSVALIAAALFFVSILAHEMAHALVGRARGVPIDAITLFLFGGVARMSGEPKSPGAELLIAAVGPLTSLVIGVVCIAAGMAISTEPSENLRWLAGLSPAASVLLWLGSTNLLLAFFNMLPGFPLDGGRVLRAALWKATGDLKRATFGASLVGRGVAFVLIFLGVMTAFGVRVPFLGGGFIQGLWLVLIGWFLDSAAVNSYQQTVITQLLADVPVSRLMRTGVMPVPATLPVSTLVDRYLMQSDQKCLPISDGDRFAGIVCMTDLRKARRDTWDVTPVRAIATPPQDLTTVRSDESAADALTKLAAYDVDQLPVVDRAQPDHLLGILRRADILRYIELQATG